MSQQIIAKAEEIIDSVRGVILEKFKVEIPPLTIIVSNRMTRVFGSALLSRTNPTIKFSGKAFAGKENTNAFRNTVIHELAHLVEFFMYGGSNHGPKWAYIMTMCGETASTYVTMEKREELEYVYEKRATKTYTHSCKCSQHQVGGKIHNKILAGVKYRCRKCKTHLTADFV